jgi:hypothetical protein
MKYMVQVWNETYGYWDWDLEFRTAAEAMEFMSGFGRGWKTRCRRINSH